MVRKPAHPAPIYTLIIPRILHRLLLLLPSYLLLSLMPSIVNRLARLNTPITTTSLFPLKYLFSPDSQVNGPDSQVNGLGNLNLINLANQVNGPGNPNVRKRLRKL